MSEKRPLFVREWESPREKWIRIAKLVAYIAVIVVILLIFIFKVIIFGNLTTREDWTLINIYFILNDPNASFIYSLLNGLLMGAYIAILANFSQQNKYVKILMLCFVLIPAILGFSIGICVGIYLPVLNPQVFESNTEQGILFFIGNLSWLMLIFFSSLVAESEVS